MNPLDLWDNLTPHEQLILLILREAEPDGLHKEEIEEKFDEYVDICGSTEDAVDFLLSRVTVH